MSEPRAPGPVSPRSAKVLAKQWNGRLAPSPESREAAETVTVHPLRPCASGVLPLGDEGRHGRGEP